jgi:hypothetical protein
MRAYEIYLQRGNGPGNEAEDWFQAESEVITYYLSLQSESIVATDGYAEGPAQAEETVPKKRAPGRTRSPEGSARKLKASVEAGEGTAKRVVKRSSPKEGDALEEKTKKAKSERKKKAE